LTCLQGKTLAEISTGAANQAATSIGSLPIWGPVVDGVWIKNLPILEAGSGHLYPIEALVVTHVTTEGGIFVPSQASRNTPSDWRSIVGSLFPNQLSDSPSDNNDIVGGALTQYQFQYPGSTAGAWANEAASLTDAISDLVFLCNARALIDHYSSIIPVYVASVDFWLGFHASDILNIELNGDSFNNLSSFRRALAAFAATTNPNHLAVGGFYNSADQTSWPQVTQGDYLTNVLSVGDFNYTIAVDTEGSSDRCTFWYWWQYGGQYVTES
jgi:carboxylesterase type B